MKKYIYLLIVLWTAVSCSNFLDETPKGTLIPQTVNDFGLMLDDYDIYGGGQNKIVMGPTVIAMMDDDVWVSDSEEKLARYQQAGLRAYRWENTIFTMSEDDFNYNDFYHCIYICNYILNNLDGAEEGGAFTKDYVRGAASFHRAYAYFCLVNMYAKHWDAETAETDLGVPLYLGSNINDQVGRATVAEVYDQIFKDLEVAESTLNETESLTTRPTLAAVYGLYARIYLYQGKFEECWQEARKSREITGEPEDYSSFYVYTPGLPDWGIGGMSYMDWEWPDVVIYKGGSAKLSAGDYNLSTELIGLFNKETDLRWQLFVTDYDYYVMTPGSDYYRIAAMYHPNNPGINVGEMWITEAEALCREGDIDGALFALNTLRKKRYVAASYTDITERDPETLLNLILEERRRELMFKGMRWFDLKRLNKEPRFAKTVTHELLGETYTLEPNSPHYVLPFPSKVIAANPLIKQNTYE